MRSILVSVLGGCLIGLIVGCGTGASNKIEKPANTVPPPTKEQLQKGLKVGGGNGGAAGNVSSPTMKPLPLPTKK